MNNINLQTVFTSAGLAIGGIMTAVWTAYELVENSYSNKLEGITMQTSLLKEEMLRLERTLERSSKNQDRIQATLVAVCSRLIEDENIAVELKKYCENIINDDQSKKWD